MFNACVGFSAVSSIGRGHHERDSLRGPWGHPLPDEEGQGETLASGWNLSERTRTPPARLGQGERWGLSERALQPLPARFGQGERSGLSERTQPLPARVGQGERSGLSERTQPLLACLGQGETLTSRWGLSKQDNYPLPTKKNQGETLASRWILSETRHSVLAQEG